MKLQDAYVAEQGIRAGNWAEIGYVMANSSNFAYCASASACTNKTVGQAGTDETAPTAYVAHWMATSQATLNDCPATSTWNLTTSQNGSSGGLVLYTATITGNGCSVLTPNFERLNTASTSTTGQGG